MALNFNDITPAPPTGTVNVRWQKDGSGNVSANVPSNVIGYNPATITDPYADVRSFGVDCTGVADSRVALQNAILSGARRIVAPTGCKIKVQASGGLGVVVLGLEGLIQDQSGWIDIDGTGGAEIFGCGAGSGAVVKFDRSGYFRFHNFNVNLTNFNLCATGSTFTRGVDWTNNGAGGVTSTKAEFHHLALNSVGMWSGGNTWPTVGVYGITATDGNQVAYVDANPSWTNLGIHQETATTIANGTVYTLNVKVALPNPGFDPGFRTSGAAATANITANGVVVATASCTVALTTWNTCTVQYTGVAGTAGQTLGVTLLNTSIVPSGGSQGGSGQWTRIFFDNVTATNFTVGNPSFETLPGGASLTSGQFLYPTPGDQWTWVQGANAFPQYVGLQIGGVGGDPNLEGWHFHDSDIFGNFLPNSYGLYNQGCCSEHAIVDNIGVFATWRGIYGSTGGVLRSIHGGGSEGANQFNYQAFGVAGGALLLPTGCAGGLEVEKPSWDGFGPIMKFIGGGACTNMVMIDPDLAGTVTASGEYTVDASNVMSLTVIGGKAQNLSGVALNNPYNAFISSGNGQSSITVISTTRYPTGLNGAVLCGGSSNVSCTVINAANVDFNSGIVTSGPFTAIPVARRLNNAIDNPSPLYQWLTSVWNGSAAVNDSFASGAFGYSGHKTLAFNYTPPPGISKSGTYAFDAPFSGVATATVDPPIIQGVTQSGPGGATTYSYKMVGKTSSGSTGASAASTTTTGATTLDTTHCNVIQFLDANTASGAGSAAFDVYRVVGGTTQGKIATVGALAAAALSGPGVGYEYAYYDCGAVGDGTSPPTVNTTGMVAIAGVTFANLGTPANGALAYCSDCTVANPCAGGGTGALAKRLNGVWVCN